MSYSVHVFPRATQAAHAKQKKKSPAFFEKESALPKFTKAAQDELLERMELVGFAEKKKSKAGRNFSNADWGASGLLTPHGLYLSASGDGVFEILQFGSEIAGEELAKYDPQENTWE